MQVASDPNVVRAPRNVSKVPACILGVVRIRNDVTAAINGREICRDCGRNRISIDGKTRQVDLPAPSALGFVRLSEDIVRGQTVAKYSVSGYDGTTWVDISNGTTIGYAKIDKITDTTRFRSVKVTVSEATAAPVAVEISAYAPTST